MLAGAMDDDARYRAVQSKDQRFDGWFFTAVTSTGIYCRPSCPAVTPKRANVRFYPSAAGAQQAGFRACKRCRPDVTPGSPEWNVRADVVGRAMRLIADGVVDRQGVSGLASTLGYSERHLNRLLIAEVGAGPLALARAQRAHAARLLLETTDLAIAQVAFGAGFASVRQFNDTVRDVFASTPSTMRAKARRSVSPTPGQITLRLPFRAPLDARHLFSFLATRAVPGIEHASATFYRRSVMLPHGPAVLDVRAEEGPSAWMKCVLHLADLRDLNAAVQRCRRLLDLDADPVAVGEALSRDRALRPLVRARPGMRVPGAVDGEEIAIRTIVGQQVSVAGARRVIAGVVARYGKPLTMDAGELTHTFPSSAVLAEADPADLPMPTARRATLLGMARALADERIALHPGVDRDEVSARLLEMPGIGPWTVSAIRMRAFGDPDAFMPTDLAVRKALRALGLPDDGRATAAEAWRPWRSYALQYLWASLDRAPERPPLEAPKEER